MTPNKLKKIQDKFRLSGNQLARLFGVSPTTISLYKRGKMNLSRTAYFIERMEAFDNLSDEGKENFIRDVFRDDAGYKKSLIGETGRIARALVEQHGYEQMEAFIIAHYSRHAMPPNFDIPAMSTAYQKASKNKPWITKTELMRILKAAGRNGMPPLL